MSLQLHVPAIFLVRNSHALGLCLQIEICREAGIYVLDCTERESVGRRDLKWL